MPEPFNLPYVQEGLIEILLLSVAAGLIGSWVVLRALSFYSHAIGTASFPGLVLADGIGFPAALGAFGMAAVFTAIATVLSRARRTAADSATALALVTCLAAGVILASDVFASGANVDNLLFGSLLAIGSADLYLAAGAAILALTANRLCSTHWLAKGFDEGTAGDLGSGSVWFDVALLGVVAVTVTAALSAVGALLVAAIMVIPPATVRMLTRRVATMQIAAVLLVAAEGVAGLWLSVRTDAPPGATIAVISGVVFALTLAARHVRRARLVTIALAAVTMVFTAGCGGGSPDGDGSLRVVATTTQVADLVSEVGGDQVDVTRIIEPNTDPHDYEPRPSDVQAFADSQVIFRSGGRIDEWTQSLIDDSGTGAEVVDLSAGLPLTLGPDGEPTAPDDDADPHWWHDPRDALAATAEIEDALVAAYPSRKPGLETGARRYQRRLGRLLTSMRRCFASIPAARRKVVTDHDAFAYLAHRFGIEVVGTVIPALTTEAQPSAGDLADLEETIRDENVKAVFPESSVSRKLSQALAADTGASADYELYGDSLGSSGSDGSTYIQMMQANARSLMLGLTGGRRGCDFD